MANVRKIWQRFLYRDSVLLEAERQKNILGLVEDWAIEFSKLLEDDVFATLIQVYYLKPISLSFFLIKIVLFFYPKKKKE